MKAIVLGGAGFIGRYICEVLVKRGYEVRVLAKDRALRALPEAVEFQQGDYLDQAAVRKSLEGVDVVYQLAGLLGTTELCEKGAALKAERVNVQGHLEILDLCCELGIRDVFFPTKPNDWCNGYSITKEAGERFSTMYTMYRGLRVRMLRWIDVFGPGQKLKPIRKAIPTWCFQASNGLPLEIYGSGEQEMELCYVEDIAKTTVDFMEIPWRMKFLEPLDCGCGVRLSVNEIARTIKKMANSKSFLTYFPMRDGQGGDWGSKENVWKYTRKVNWKHLDHSLWETVSFYKNLPEQQRNEVLFYRYGTTDVDEDSVTLQARQMQS